MDVRWTLKQRCVLTGCRSEGNKLQIQCHAGVFENLECGCGCDEITDSMGCTSGKLHAIDNKECLCVFGVQEVFVVSMNNYGTPLLP